MSRLVGVPDVAAASTLPLTATLTWAHAYQRGDRLATGKVDLTYDRDTDEWLHNGLPFDLLAARFGQSDITPPHVRILFMLGATGGTSLTFQPIENAAGIVDLTKPLSVASWVTGAEFESLRTQQQNAIAELSTFAAEGRTVATDISTGLGLLDAVLADIEQYAGGIERRDSLAEIDAAPDGLYRNIGETGGPIYQRKMVDGSLQTIPRPDLNGARAAQVEAAQAAADTAQARINASLDSISAATQTTGRILTELGTFDVIPAAGQTVNGGTVRSIGVPNFVAKLGYSGALPFAAFRPDTNGAAPTSNAAKMQAAITETLTAQEAAELRLPPGVITLNAATLANSGRDLVIRGAGRNRTTLLIEANTPIFELDLTAGGGGTLHLADLTLAINVAGHTDSLLRLTGAGRLPSFTTENVTFAGPCRSHVNLFNVKETKWLNTLFAANGRADTTGAQFGGDNNATSHTFTACSAYNVQLFVEATSTGVPGVEGLKFVQCDAINVRSAVHYHHSVPDYAPPQITWIGGNINAGGRVFDLTGIEQLTVLGALVYLFNPGDGSVPTMVSGPGINQFLLSGNTVLTTDGTPFRLADLSNVSRGGQISGNLIYPPGAQAGDNPVIALAADTTGIDVFGNTRRGGGKLVTDLGTNTIGKNYPDDPEDVQNVVSSTSGTLDIGRRGGYVIIGGTAGSTIGDISARPPGQTVTLQFDASTTLSHTAGLLLAGQTGATLSGGQTITLYRQPGGWREISRQ